MHSRDVVDQQLDLQDFEDQPMKLQDVGALIVDLQDVRDQQVDSENVGDQQLDANIKLILININFLELIARHADNRVTHVIGEQDIVSFFPKKFYFNL